MAGVFDNPPGFPYTPPGVDVLEGGKLTSNNVAGSSHDPLQSFAMASGAVSKPGDAAGQDALHSAGVEGPEDSGARSKLPQPSWEEEAQMCLLQHCVCVSWPCEVGHFCAIVGTWGSINTLSSAPSVKRGGKRHIRGCLRGGPAVAKLGPLLFLPGCSGGFLRRRFQGYLGPGSLALREGVASCLAWAPSIYLTMSHNDGVAFATTPWNLLF